MKKEQYDLIICHTPMGGVLTRIAARLAKNSPVVYMAHGFHFYHGAPFLNNFLYKNIEKFLARWTDCIITINQEDFEAAKKFHLRGNSSMCFKTYGIGAKVSDIKNCYVDREKKRESLGIPRDAVVVTNVAELIKRKNHETAIKAIANCKNKNVVLLICGRGVLEEKLKLLVRKLKLDDKVFFLGYRQDIKEILKISDIFVFPSHQEGLPVAVMEAMAAGLPVVCSKIRGNVDLIEGMGGYFHSPKDFMELSKKIDELADNQELRLKFGEFNLKNVERYDIKNVIVDIENIYLNTFAEHKCNQQKNK